MLYRTLFFFLALCCCVNQAVAMPTTCVAHQDDSQKRVTIAVMVINDFHAGLISDVRQNQPGAAYVLQTIDSLKQVYPYHVVLSAGDNFGGSFFYNATRKQSLLPQMFKDMGITISAVGNHEFDDGQESLAEKWKDTDLLPKDWQMTYVCANCRNESGRIPTMMQPWAVVPVKVGEKKFVNLALVGLLTSNTPWQASAKRLKGLSFDGNYPVVIDSVRRLSGYEAVEKADIRMLLTHIGTQMRNGRPVWDDRDSVNLQKLNLTDFHAIISAHSHSEVVGMSDSRHPLPITQGLWHGQYVSVLKCDVDTDGGKVISVVPELVRVNANATLSPKAARLQAQVNEQYHTTLFRGMPLSQKLTSAPQDIPHDRKQNTEQTRMGTLVTASFAAAYRRVAGLNDDALVVGVSHFGSIRAGFLAGDVTVLNVGESLPFANPLRVYRYTGAELMSLMNHGINVCTLGRIQAAGVNVKQDAKGRVVGLSLTLPNGRTLPIKTKTPLVLVADEYMTTGGDGYLPSQFPKEKELKVDMPTSTDAFIAYLRKLPQI